MARQARKTAKPGYPHVTYHDQTVPRAPGGETHQLPDGEAQPDLTTQQGAPVAYDQNSLRDGTRGPLLVEDFHFREKIFHFDHERIPERVVHARGFVIDRAHRSYAGKLGIERMAEIIRGAHGRRGACSAYLENTVRRLDQLGIPDRRLHELLAAVRGGEEPVR